MLLGVLELGFFHPPGHCKGQGERSQSTKEHHDYNDQLARQIEFDRYAHGEAHGSKGRYGFEEVLEK